MLRRNIDVDDFANSLSNTQYKSKKWLVDSLKLQQIATNPSILIIGGWYGSYLVPMLNETINPSRIILTDANPVALEVADILHKRLKPILEVKTLHVGVDTITDSTDILINTSCEHMISPGVSSNPNCFYVLQSCDNKNDPGHINTSQTTADLVQKSGLTKITFSGRLALGHKNRFMVMGYR